MRHLTEEQLQGYRAGTLASGPEYLEIDDHLSKCPECRARLRLDDPAERAELAELFDETSHPDADLVALYVTHGESAVTPKTARHIEGCPRCRSEVGALRDYLERIQPETWERARSILEPDSP